jgi:transglutaminase-like putative cysteine protease
MSRARVADSLLALLAVLAVVAPFRALFTPDSWIPGALAMALSVTVSGMVMRALTLRDAPVVLTQIGVGVLLAGWLFGRGHLWYGLPRWQTVIAFNNILIDARETITSYAPPAPSSRGVILAMALIVWLTMLLVDFLAVTRGSPALAGVPLFVAFLIAASNSGSGMPVRYFVVAAVLWLVLLSRSRLLSLTRWDSGIRAGATGGAGTLTGSGARRLAPTARVIGISAVLVATLGAALLPHMPTRFLLDGLGRSTDATGTTGTMTINSTVNLARSLESQSNDPVLVYRTSASSATPLRVAILDLYQGGEWREREILGIPRSDTLIPSPVDPASESETIDVSTNNLAAPQLALPYPATSLTIDARWQSRGDGTVLVERRQETYSAEYISRAPDEETLQSSGPLPDGISNLTPDAASADVVRDILDEIITPGMSQIDKARAIQDHLRGPEYTYSLELAGPTVNAGGNLVQLDPLSHFLLTKQGYCTQFASAMVMMARTEGIPARFAIGFLPGSTARDGERTVVAADAHAWPELYFSGVGWLPFEPTPGARASSVPGYTSPDWGDPEGSNATSTATSTPTGAPTRDRPEDIPLDDTDVPIGATGSTSTLVSLMSRFGWLVVVLLVGALGAAAMPASAWWERRRRRQQAADDAARVEVIWQDLLERLDDVGVVPPPDATPRQAGSYIWGETFLTKESRGALTRIVAAVEQARYARPEGLAEPDRVAAIEHDAQTVSSNVVTSLQRSQRVRANWWPTAGVSAWRRLGARLMARLPWQRD